MLVLATAIVPFEIYMVPLFLQMNALKLVNTQLGLFLPFLVLSYGIFFMRQNTITSVPDELLDAARIDGMSESGIMLRFVPRLLAPAIAPWRSSPSSRPGLRTKRATGVSTKRHFRTIP